MWAATSASLNGIIGGHAYSMTHAITLSNGQNLIKMRNPWGNSEWTGAWSDNSKLWTDDLKEKFGCTKEDDGTFFIEFEDYIPRFSDTCVAFNNLDKEIYVAEANYQKFETVYYTFKL